jgi:hypothetical protein
MIAPDNPEARRELLGHTIYSVDLSGLLPMLRLAGEKTDAGACRPQLAKMPTSAFTVTDTHLIFASEYVVEQTIRTLSSNADNRFGKMVQ